MQSVVFFSIADSSWPKFLPFWNISGAELRAGGFCVVHTCIQWANKCSLLAGLSQGFKPYDLVYVKRIAFYMLDRKMGGCACKNAVPFSQHQSLEMYKIWKQLGNGLKGESDAKSLPFYWYFFCYIAMYCIVLQCNECIVTLFLFLWMFIFAYSTLTGWSKIFTHGAQTKTFLEQNYYPSRTKKV